jgi:hypothetical protein
MKGEKMTVSVVFAIAGVIAILFGIIGGGIKVKEIEVPLLSTRVRIITVIIGLVLIGFTLWEENYTSTSAQVKPTPTSAQVVITIIIDAQSSTWSDTGIFVQKSDQIKIEASGAIDLGGVQSGPNGNPGIQPAGNGVVPTAPYGTLVGMIGSGNSFIVGSFYQGISQSDGNLELIINDVPSQYADNSGQFHITITITKGN